MKWKRLGAAVIAAVVFAAGLWTPAPAAPTTPSPTLTKPPAGVRGYPLWDSYYHLKPFGYAEEEFFVSGKATALDGSTKRYTTRIIVTRPKDPASFNGTVLLDWVNVTAQFENAVDTMLAREMFMREGFAYVHVSAQSVGVCCTPLTPKVWDPVRYDALDHPGDAYAFDMFTQVAKALKAPRRIDPMGTVGASNVKRVIAAGQSQSANQLEEYIQDWLPSRPEAVGVIDGILVHGNVPGDKSFGAISAVPVLHLLSDYEAEDDGVDPATVDPRYRLWEVAGAAHADYFIGYQSEFGHGPRVTFGTAKANETQYRAIIEEAGNYGEIPHPLMGVCTANGATMPMRYVTSTAIHELAEWAGGGGAPDNGPRFEFAGGALATDEHGNTLGGIRLPPMDVPVARSVSTICQLGGITVPFTDAEIQSLYGTHAEYLALMAEHTDRAVADGWLLPADAVDLMRRACEASVRFGEAAQCPPYEPPPFDQPLPVAPAAPAAAPAPVAVPDAPPPAAVPAESPRALARTGGDTPLVAAFALLATGVLGRRIRVR